MPGPSMSELLQQHLTEALPEDIWKKLIEGFCNSKVFYHLDLMWPMHFACIPSALECVCKTLAWCCLRSSVSPCMLAFVPYLAGICLAHHRWRLPSPILHRAPCFKDMALQHCWPSQQRDVHAKVGAMYVDSVKSPSQFCSTSAQTSYMVSTVHLPSYCSIVCIQAGC